MESIDREICTLDDVATIYPTSTWFTDVELNGYRNLPYPYIQPILYHQEYFISVKTLPLYTPGFVLVPKDGIDAMYISLILNSSLTRTHLKATRLVKKTTLTTQKLKKIPFISVNKNTQSLLGLIHQCSQALNTEEQRRQDPFHLHKTRTFQNLRDAVCHELFDPDFCISYHFDIINDWILFVQQYLNTHPNEKDHNPIELTNACYLQMMDPASNLTRDIKRMQYELGSKF